MKTNTKVNRITGQPKQEEQTRVDYNINRKTPEIIAIDNYSYESAWHRLDEIDNSLNILHSELKSLIDKLDGVLADCPDQDEPVPGPRKSNSNITSRLCNHADFIDDLVRKVIETQRRLTV